MRNFNKKFIALIFTALILFSVRPLRTTAALSTFETNPKLVGTQTIFQSLISGATIKEVIQTFFEYAKDVAVETLKKQLLNMLVDQIVNWIQGGGDPKFITNWPGFFRDAVDQAGGKFIDNFALKYGVNLCSPFKPILGAGFIPIPTFTTRTACTLNAIGVNLDAFLKDFKQGGWVAWREMVLRPQNNIYGAYALAWDQYEIEKSAAAKSAAAEAQAGKGFLSAKKCIETKLDQADASECADIAENVKATCAQYQADETAYNACMNQAARTETSCRGQATYCSKEQVITPGAVIGDLAAQAVGSDIDWLVNSKDLAAYTAAITNAILNRMFAEGVGLLHTAISGGTGSSGGGGSGGGGSTAQAQCSKLLGTAAYNDCLAAMQSGIDIREFEKKYMISSIDQELDYQNQLLGAKQATFFVLNQSVVLLNQLKDCQGTASPALAQVQNTASTTTSQITQIQSDIIALQIKQQEIKAVTDLLQIPSLWAQVAGVVNPAATYSLVLAAQQETSQKQQDMSLYQQQLDFCTQQ